MELQKRKKLNKILIIAAIVLILILIIFVIVFYFFNKQEEKNYEDTVTAKNYFVEITVDLSSKEVKRDEKETTLIEEFGVTEEQQTLMLSSEEELKNYFADSTFEVNIQDEIAYITNDYQTKKLIIEVNELEGSFNRDNIEEIEEIQEGIYVLTFDTQKRTKDAYENFLTVDWIENIEIDEVSIITTMNDISQTVYEEDTEEDEKDTVVYGVSAMGLDNYQDIINENGNVNEVVIATVGYGASIENEYFSGRISDNSYNFIEDSTNIYETVAQGNRILEVIKESTTDNVKIMPLVVIDSENYTTTVTIMEALTYATENSDVILYEFINSENYMIDMILKNAFKENVPVCTITSSSVDTEENYPANNSTTIAVASIDKSGNLASYSGSGDYLDFSAYSTDVEEIFDTSSSISRWSGEYYSSAEIVAAISLIKSYNKDYTILEVYNELRNYCVDLGEEGKDDQYGYGCPNFSDLSIADIDKNDPEIQEIIYNNDEWEIEKSIQIKASDNIRVYAWAVTNSEDTPTEWNELEEITPDIDVTGIITENGTYYIWIKDSAGNTTSQSIDIDKIDTTAPVIQYAIDTSTQDSEDYVTISVSATDEESGLNETPYSWDNENWGADNNELKVTENGRYTVYVKDTLENVSSQEIVVDVFDEEGVADIEDGEIIKAIYVSANWDGNTNNEVKITFKNSLKITGWAISKTTNTPSNFTSVVEEDDGINGDAEDEDAEDDTDDDDDETSYSTNVSITTSLDADVKYYVWIKDNEGNVYYQGFTISKAEV